MDEDITQQWGTLNLTKEKQQELLLPEEAVSSTKTRGNHCLMALILNDHNANRDAFKTTMAKVWNTEGWLTFKDLGTNNFLLEFQLVSNKEKVLQGRPWSFDCHLICLKDSKRVLAPNKVQFISEFFWVQVHNLPFAGKNELVGKRIGEAIGKVHAMEVDDQGCGWGSFLRIRVEVNITKPLIRGRMINLGGKQCWAYFKYECLPTLCFKCGLLKHVKGKCPNFNLVSQSQEQYGQWLRAPTALPHHLSVKKFGGPPSPSPQGPHSSEQSH